MSSNRNLNFLLTALLQLVLIVGAVVLAYHFTRDHLIIPKSVIRLPEVYVSHADMWDIVSIFVVVYVLQIALTRWKYGTAAFSTPKRFANEYLFYLYAYTTASLYLFLATTINYDPQLIAGIGLFSTLAYVAAFWLCAWLFGKQGFGVIGQAVGALFKRIVTIPGILALVYFLVPLLMGKAFTADRDVANVITQIRIFFNPVSDTEWGFKNRLPGLAFAQPVLVKQAPNDDESLYVLERAGKVYRVSADMEKVLVLDISDRMGEVEIENGSVGLAFHPNFNHPQTPEQSIFVYYTDTRPEDFQYNRLSRFTLTGDAQQNADSEMFLLELVRNDSGFHNGGSVEFGPDGYLYIGIGEGVHPPEASTSDKVLRSGVLRIDVNMDAQTGQPPQPFEYGLAQNYYVPNDNPFVDNDKIRNEYWALGLRNPFRFQFDSQTGQLWLGDVGSTIWEEVNLIEKGKHYQFPVIEGRQKSGKRGSENLDIPQQGPVYTYEHNAYDRAVIGGIIDRSDRYPALKDRYVFADNYSAKLFAMDATKSQVEEVELLARANQYAQRGISSVVQLNNGEILVTTLGAASEPSGEVLLLVKADEADVFRVEEEESVPEGYDEKATAALFAVNCARCHGVKGDGKGPDSEMLGVEMPDLTSPLFHFNRSSEEIHAVIEKGGIGVGKSAMMPPWGGFLKPEEINNLVIYIESLPEKHHQH